MIDKVKQILVKSDNIRSHMNCFRSTCTNKEETSTTSDVNNEIYTAYESEIQPKIVSPTDNNMYWRLNNVWELFCFANNERSSTKLWIKDKLISHIESNQLTSISTSVWRSKIIILSNKPSQFSCYCRDFTATYRWIFRLRRRKTRKTIPNTERFHNLTNKNEFCGAIFTPPSPIEPRGFTNCSISIYLFARKLERTNQLCG